MLAGQPGHRQIQLAMAIAIANPVVANSRVPVEPARLPDGAGVASNLADPVGDGRRIELRHQWHAALGNPRLFCANLDHRLAQESLVVETEAGDAGYQRLVDNVGRVEPSAEADLQDARICRRFRKGEEGNRGIDLEQAGADRIIGIDHLAHQVGEPCVVDQLAGDADPLIVTNQMRAGERMDALASGLERGSEECAGRTLAVGPGDMENRGQPVLGPAELVEQGRDPVEVQIIAVDILGCLPIDQCRDTRIRRADHFLHYAAFFLSFSGAR
jgi:hypothetical protein